MTEVAVFKSFGKGAKKQEVTGLRAVVYTRVSSKDQATNLSLDTQRKACVEYAQKRNYEVVKFFGATYESATSDSERKEFSSMISFVKRAQEKISHIIVFSLDKFSRNLNSIAVTAELKRMNILVQSVTQPIDMTSSVGQMHANMTLLFSTWENELRVSKCTAGMREMLFRGDWPTKPPLGYDSVKINGQRTIVPNDKGRILANAFRWKAQERLSDEQIRIRLARNGIVLCHQRVAETLRNVFYCGMLSHKMLDGAVVKGNHKGIISQELFLQANGVLSQNTHGYSIKKENDEVPLKRFLKCDKCGYPLAGYLVKKKNIHYYKCSTVGCGTNRNAKILHERFAEILEYFSLDASSEVLHLIKQEVVAIFNQYTEGYIDEQTVLEQRQKELQGKIQRLEERLITEEIPSELYYKYTAKYTEELTGIEDELSKASFKFSNLSECIDLAVDFATGIAKKWLSADYNIKQRIQNLLFPEGVYYNRENDNYRTMRINSVFGYLAVLKLKTQKIERGIADLTIPQLTYSGSVAGAGLEPTTFGL